MVLDICGTVVFRLGLPFVRAWCIVKVLLFVVVLLRVNARVQEVLVNLIEMLND